ncbi:MAG: DUF4864 domain-containing protein [Silicimonas sp.]|nr:DUF4864 domain-containing protein [Silicimonas sp.]
MAIWAQGAFAEDLAPNMEIEGTIASQIEAFRADDFAQAFTFASPNIRRMFGTSENFGMMVRQGYPMVWRPGQLQFLELRDEQGLLWQKVMVQDQEGVFFVLDYQMVETPDGWRINGVYLVQAPQLGA